MPKATVNGVETEYEVHGAGTPVLFIHGGWGGPASSLAPTENAVTSALTENVQLIMYDRRGAGQSESILDDFTVADIAADGRALLDHLGIENSIVIGHSMGGMVAQQYALDYPEKVIGVCLAATGSDLMTSIPLGHMGTELVERCRNEGDRVVFESLQNDLRNPPPYAPTDEPRTPEAEERMKQRSEVIAQALKEISEEELFRSWAGMVRNYGAFIGRDMTPRHDELTMPVLILHGTGDTIVPFDHATAMHATISQSELSELDGAGHGVFDFPNGQDAIRAWVKSLS